VIVDTSALVAVIRGEDDSAEFVSAVRQAHRSRISAGNYLEAGIVIDRKRDAAASRRLDTLLSAMRIEVAPVTSTQAGIARQAYRDFGKASGHPARLNFGDCFAYALAIDTDEPLLFKGDDFTHTDVRVADR
jgi:ribonuclease VapC